ncbi:hypothetical protein G6F64_000460 [Rhizopus arrhizus]|uniref:Tc1-like transposase DDE domain-containing protein n=1 Tax=Rhizopus oryzae TaxID=64495 RepID=A0A9P7BXL5_RHIOR|nr:hypothetical protein G6F64_000460 [Rhizopus arrhizus]
MKVDDETYPLDSVTNYDQYIDLKPPEKQVGLNVAQAARKLCMPTRTAQGWYDRDQQNPQDIIQRKTAKNPVGRPPSLGEEHRVFLVYYIDKKPSLILDEIMDGLSAQFMDLSISKTAVYNFIKEKCRISLKKAYFHSVERNSFENIERRYKWIKIWMETDIDYLSNCIFIDEAAFHIGMKRTVAWSKIGSRAEVVMPKTRAKTTTILGAISPYGVINVKVRKPRAVNQNKKRRRRGYGCVYLPPYSPELNPIEQHWSVCKSKMKREELLQEETLSSRIHIL